MNEYLPVVKPGDPPPRMLLVTEEEYQELMKERREQLQAELDAARAGVVGKLGA